MKNILITLGCSFTQGDGCWDLETLKKPLFNGKPFKDFTFREKSILFEFNQDRFLKLGWPSRLQEMLGYDELYNLGFGGASISHSVKMFMEDIYYKDFTNCNVLVIQLGSFPHRISFYKNGIINTLNHGNPIHDNYIKEVTIEDDSFEESTKTVDDTTLEFYFYMKMMKELCENKGWNFLFTSVRGTENIHMNRYIDKDKLESNFMSFKESLVHYPDEYRSEICGHPNDKWYDIMAKRMYECISVNKKEIQVGNSTSFKKERILPKLYTLDIS